MGRAVLRLVLALAVTSPLACGPMDPSAVAQNGPAGPAALHAVYYVAPGRSDSNPCTRALPFRTFARAQRAASAGDTVANSWYGNTSCGNHPDFNMLGLRDGVAVDLGVLRNNLAFGGTLLANEAGGDDADNSWTLPVSVSSADFVSLSTSGWDAPRQVDGSLPALSSLHLATSSDLVDEGVDVGLPYLGAAPDLGAFEAR